MSIRNVLRHRCKIDRSERVIDPEDVWSSAVLWRDIAADVPCLLDPTGQQREAFRNLESDREGVLFLLPGVDAQSGDRVTMTSGGTGVWSLSVDPHRVNDLRQASHVEWPVAEVAA